MKKIFLFLLLSVSASFALCAQRLIPGQWVVSGAFGIVPASGVPYLFEASFDKVDYGRIMDIRLNFLRNRGEYVSYWNDPETRTSMYVPYSVCNNDVYLSWGYMFDIVHNRRRSLNFRGGVTFDAGTRIISVGSGLLDDIPDSLPRFGLLLGASPELSFEYFPAASFSVSGYFRPHMHWLIYGEDYSSDRHGRWLYPVLGVRCSKYLFLGK